MITELRLLVTQSDDIVTVTEGEVPVLGPVGNEGSIDPFVVRAVNFLRAGAPKVQIVLSDIEGARLKQIENANALLVQIGRYLISHDDPRVAEITRFKQLP